MKTTLELPDSLVKQVKLRALQDGRKLKETVADLLRKGLAAREPMDAPRQATIAKHRKTGLPVIVGGHPASPAHDLTPDRVAAILLAQEAGWHHDTGR